MYLPYRNLWFRNNINDVITGVNEGEQEETNPETKTYDPYQIVVGGNNDDDNDDRDDNPDTTPGSAPVEEEEDTQSTGVAPENKMTKYQHQNHQMKN